MNPFTADVVRAARAHARECYPDESCGLVIEGRYVGVINAAADPRNDFEIPVHVWQRYLPGGFGTVQGVVHSHPDGPLFPSKPDMESQIRSALPWAIIPLDEERVGEPIIWGDQLGVLPLLGREFRHGITDCYSTIRDAFRLGKDGLAAQGFDDWPYDPIVLPEVPRGNGWWKGADDLYTDNFAKFGFHKIQMSDARPGDVFLARIRSSKLNHGGVMVGGGLIVHHLPGRLSRREPAGIWGRTADLWIRYGAAGA